MPNRPLEDVDLSSTDPLEALRAECELVSELVLGLPESDFSRPTRCGAWNVKELVAHMYRDIARTHEGLDQDEPDEPDSDAVSYWGRYDPAVDATAIADRAKQFASEYGSGQELAVAWDELWRRALGRAQNTPRDRIIRTWGPALTMDDFLATRVLEITIHRADLHDALGMPPSPTEGGLEITNEIMLGLLDADPTQELPFDGVELMEKGSGRAELTDEDRQALGDLADRFPLMS